jgi:hypothetical protein
VPAADNVRIGSTGGVYVAPSGTTLPTNATTALHATFQAANLGYMDENGVALAIDEEIQNIRAWQNGVTVRTVKSGQTTTVTFTPMETNSIVLNEWMPGGFSANAGEITAEQSTTKSWIVEILDQGNDIRLVIPSGQLTTRGTVTFSNGAAVTYPFTITCYPDGNGVEVYYYIASEAS